MSPMWNTVPLSNMHTRLSPLLVSAVSFLPLSLMMTKLEIRTMAINFSTVSSVAVTRVDHLGSACASVSSSRRRGDDPTDDDHRVSARGTNSSAACPPVSPFSVPGVPGIDATTRIYTDQSWFTPCCRSVSNVSGQWCDDGVSRRAWQGRLPRCASAVPIKERPHHMLFLPLLLLLTHVLQFPVLPEALTIWDACTSVSSSRRRGDGWITGSPRTNSSAGPPSLSFFCPWVSGMPPRV